MLKLAKSMVKTGLISLSPEVAERVIQQYRLARFHWIVHQMGLARITKEFVARYGCNVQNGPFAGMLYVEEAVGSMLLPKLIGSYEAELQGEIEQICRGGYTTIIDIGAAEGYYAVGLARRMPHAHIIAFETDPRGRELCKTVAVANGVEKQLTILGKCDPEILNLALTTAGNTLVICDVEGYERELLDPERVPGLREVEILVEFHDHVDASISPTILSRFDGTHAVRLISTTPRQPGAFSCLSWLCPQDQGAAMDEFRPSQGQLFGCFTVKHIQAKPAELAGTQKLSASR